MELYFRDSLVTAGTWPIYATKEEAFNEKGTIIGLLYRRESCVYTGVTETNGWGARASKIEFMNSSGAWRTGWTPFNGSYLKSWERSPNAVVNGNPRYKITKTTNIYNGSKVLVATLYAGDYVYTRPGGAFVGATEHDWLRCFAYKRGDQYREPGYTLFVKTEVKKDPSNPRVRGNW